MSKGAVQLDKGRWARVKAQQKIHTWIIAVDTSISNLRLMLMRSKRTRAQHYVTSTPNARGEGKKTATWQVLSDTKRLCCRSVFSANGSIRVDEVWTNTTFRPIKKTTHNTDVYSKGRLSEQKSDPPFDMSYSVLRTGKMHWNSWFFYFHNQCEYQKNCDNKANLFQVIKQNVLETKKKR